MINMSVMSIHKCLYLQLFILHVNIVTYIFSICLGLTPLCVAVKANHVEIVKELIENHGADVEAIVS